MSCQISPHEKSKSSHKKLFGLQVEFYLAKKMGEKLGRGKILQ
jgi:hypothetical protein